MSSVYRTCFILLAVTLSLCGCGRNESNAPAAPRESHSQPTTQPPSAMPAEVAMQIGSLTFTLEVAATEAQQQQGLMHRRSMTLDRGMIFVFEDERPRSFWMRNTHIPLDIVYLSAAGRVVSVLPMQPLDESPVRSRERAQFAVEVNRGMAQAAGVSVGDIVKIPADIESAIISYQSE